MKTLLPEPVCGTVIEAAAYSTGNPCGRQFTPATSLPIQLPAKCARKQSKTAQELGPLLPVGHLDETPGFHLAPDLVFVAILGKRSKPTGGRSPSPTLPLPFKLNNKSKKSLHIIVKKRTKGKYLH